MRCKSPKCKSCRRPRTFAEIMSASVEDLAALDRFKVNLPRPSQDCETNSVCEGCVHCRDCSHCYSCYQCKRCTQCVQCQACVDCLRCVRCTDCTDCKDCYGIDGGERNRYLVFGVQLTDRQWGEFQRHLGGSR
jgi:hypothetical protein